MYGVVSGETDVWISAERLTSRMVTCNNEVSNYFW
jgi:hypothetical protein